MKDLINTMFGMSTQNDSAYKLCELLIRGRVVMMSITAFSNLCHNIMPGLQNFVKHEDGGYDVVLVELDPSYTKWEPFINLVRHIIQNNREEIERLQTLNDELAQFSISVIFHEEPIKVGDVVTVVEGASQWMKNHGFWLDAWPYSIDGMEFTVRSIHMDLGEISSHFWLENDTVKDCGVHSKFVIKKLS